MKFVIARGDNNHYLMVNESNWSHNIHNAKSYSEESGTIKIEELESDLNNNFRVYLSPLKEEFNRYRELYG